MTRIATPATIHEWERTRVGRRAYLHAQIHQLEQRLDTTLAVRGTDTWPTPVDGDTIARIRNLSDRELTVYAADTNELIDALKRFT